MLFSLSCPAAQEFLPRPWITVFIHGTIKGQWTCHSFPRVMWDHNIINSTYEKAVRHIRNDPFFYHLHAMQEKGLMPVRQWPTNNTMSGAPIIALAHEKISSINKDKQCNNFYYTFGWKGIVSQKVRFAEAQSLHNALTQEIKKIEQKYKHAPAVRLIGYSHGGNICLKLAQVKSKQEKDNFTIDELILIGMPVQKETDFLVQAPLFKKIYHFYSCDDHTQTADFFSFKRFFFRSCIS